MIGIKKNEQKLCEKCFKIGRQKGSFPIVIVWLLFYHQIIRPLHSNSLVINQFQSKNIFLAQCSNIIIYLIKLATKTKNVHWPLTKEMFLRKKCIFQRKKSLAFSSGCNYCSDGTISTKNEQNPTRPMCILETLDRTHALIDHMQRLKCQKSRVKH